MSEFKSGDRVSFFPSGRSKQAVTAEVTGEEGSGRDRFLITKDAAGKERRIRPGACTKVA
jgi:hypothetical protein